MSDYYRERRGVRASETVIDRRELERLRRLARRGADYEAAARAMRSRHAAMLESRQADPENLYIAGWLAAMREFAEAVVGGPDAGA